MPASIPGPVDSSDDIRLALRSWPEVEGYLESCKGIIIPLGSTEQHGPTGAIGTDALTAEAVSLAVGRRSGVLVTPTQCFGMAEHHLGFVRVTLFQQQCAKCMTDWLHPTPRLVIGQVVLKRNSPA